MKLRTHFFILMATIFVAFMATIQVYSQYLADQINRQWGAHLTNKQVLFDKQRTLQPLLREIALAKQLALEPAILQMALHENDAQARKGGLAVLEQYRLQFQDHSYFAGLVQSGHYYFNDADNQYAGQPLRYTLARQSAADAWFFSTVAEARDYQVNVDPDVHLGNTKVWINVTVKQGGKVWAVVGTGIDLHDFLKQTVDDTSAGTQNLFIDRSMAVQLHPNLALIDYATLTKPAKQRRKVDMLLTAPSDVEHLRQAMLHLEANPDQIDTLRVTYAGKKMLLGVAFLPEVGWFDLTLIDDQSLRLMGQFDFMPIFSLLFLSGLIAAGVMLHRLVLKPLSQMVLTLQAIEKGNYDLDIPVVGTGEIALLSAQFKQMLQVVRDSQQDLEQKVAQRTEQLSLELLGRQRAENELRRSETLWRTLYDSTSDAVMLLTEERFFNCNRATLRLFGIKTFEQFYTKHPADLSPARQPGGEDSTQLAKQYIAAAIAQGSLHFEWEHQRADNGKIFPADVLLNAMQLDGKTVLQAVVRDISTRKRSEEQIWQLAYYDTLTQLPNRRMLNDRLRQAMVASKRSGHYGAVLFIDLDNFKPLNDRYGHAVGDLLLIEAGSRLKGCVREQDTVARFGGDEFVVMLSELDEDKQAARNNALLVAQKILSALSVPYVLTLARDEKPESTVEHRCSASIGVALFINHEGSPDDILKWADAAMYAVKEAGRNSIRIYEQPASQLP